MENLTDKLDQIYDFLIDNRQYNKELQEKCYKSELLWLDTTQEKVLSLLFNSANTQSQPNIDKLASFYQFLHEDLSSMSSFDAFVYRISGRTQGTYQDLFNGLKAKDGWGGKTSALFVKKIFHIHNGQYNPELMVWSDAPGNIMSDDRLYLPVDRVIQMIFRKLEPKNWSFSSINKLLAECYQGDRVEVWDDLWYWGFITQKVSNNERLFEWNHNKYWALENSVKAPEYIERVRVKAEQFLALL